MNSPMLSPHLPLRSQPLVEESFNTKKNSSTTAKLFNEEPEQSLFSSITIPARKLFQVIHPPSLEIQAYRALLEALPKVHFHELQKEVTKKEHNRNRSIKYVVTTPTARGALELIFKEKKFKGRAEIEEVFTGVINSIPLSSTRAKQLFLATNQTFYKRYKEWLPQPMAAAMDFYRPTKEVYEGFAFALEEYSPHYRKVEVLKGNYRGMTVILRKQQQRITLYLAHPESPESFTYRAGELFTQYYLRKLWDSIFNYSKGRERIRRKSQQAGQQKTEILELSEQESITKLQGVTLFSSKL